MDEHLHPPTKCSLMVDALKRSFEITGVSVDARR